MKYPIALPISPEKDVHIQKLTTTVLGFQKKIRDLRKENGTLATIRDTLLPKLMSGEICPNIGN